MNAVYSTSIVLILGVIALFVWVTQVNPVSANGPTTNTSASVASARYSFSLVPYTAAGVSSVTLNGFDGNGVVFIDTADGSPQTPYLAFETAKGTISIKELLFLNNGQQPCQVSAGEYPCAPNVDGSNGAASDASPVPSGTAVHIVGGIDDQGIIVQTISTLANVPSGMVRFATQLGGSTLLTNSLSVKPIQIFDNASCTLGVGCFGNGIQRLETTLSLKNSTLTTELVPGTLFVFGNSTIILLSITGSGASAVAHFLVGAH